MMRAGAAFSGALAAKCSRQKLCGSFAMPGNATGYGLRTADCGLRTMAMAKWQIANAVPTSTGLGHSFIPLFSFICMSFASTGICDAPSRSLTRSLARHARSRPLAHFLQPAFPAFLLFHCLSWWLCWGHVCLPGCQLLMAVMCIINMHCTARPAALYFASVFLLLFIWTTQKARDVRRNESCDMEILIIRKLMCAF